MTALKIRELSVDEVEEISGGFLPPSVTVPIAIAAGTAIALYGVDQLKAWIESAPARTSAEIPTNIIKEIMKNSFKDNGQSCSPLPSDEGDLP